MAEKAYDKVALENHMSSEKGTVADPRRWWILAIVSIGTFLTNLDVSITSIALPTLSAEFHVTITVVQWVMSAYLLTICALLPIAGKLSDLLGKGRLYNFGFLIFTVGSCLSALSFSFIMLIGAKIIQALGGVLVMANTQAIVAVTFEAKERGRALGIAGIAVSLGVLSGPGLGGFLIEHFGWPSIFLVNVPIGLLGFAAGLWVMPKDRTNQTREPFDYCGSVLFMTGMTTLLYTVSSTENQGWTSWQTIIGLLGSTVVLGLFYLWEKRTAYPMLDFSLFRIKEFQTSIVTAYLSVVAMYCVIILMPFYLQDVLLLSPGATGYVMVAYPLLMGVTAPLAGWLSDRFGSYLLTSGGLVIIGLGFVALTFLSIENSLWQVAGNIAIFGIGQGMFQPSNNSSLMGAVPRTKVGLAGGLNALTRNIGMVTGISFAVSLFTFRLRNTGGTANMEELSTVPPELFMSALDTVFWGAALLSAAGVAVSLLRGEPDKLHQKDEEHH
ncbi:MFS transporter [Neobacillus drentensis]|uniref:MFS transporter n=1 Tax=Neobacillus drentensis TaxID=220684 RepID=UPI002FFFBCCF